MRPLLILCRNLTSPVAFQAEKAFLPKCLEKRTYCPYLGLRLFSDRKAAEEMTVAGCSNYWRKIFEEKGIAEPQHSSEYIISHVMGAKTFQCLGEAALHTPVTDDQRRAIWQLCFNRLQRMPVQYVIQEWDFRDLTLKMKPPVFIPRPETEELVGLVLQEFLQEAQSPEKERKGSPLSHGTASPVFLEIGCGSGAISLSLLHSLPQSHAVAVDKSPDAVDLARDNAESLGCQDRIQLLHLDVLSDAKRLLSVCGSVDFVISNPPYVFRRDMDHLSVEILSFEDRGALDGGIDGMDVIKRILSLAPMLLKDYGKVFLEVDPRHPEMIQEWLQMQPNLPLICTAVHRDFCNKPRFCVLQRNAQAVNPPT
ncbi:MTRF1L release factor glutamine methyltransferase isoform X1 [Latimeria chalumnae]|uniref:MTRF1L release factor glutamine methyltransferase isoform X1 n=1 Tax=Latimeria chalumnae TaxID=7897 RepID=UPI00313C3F63